MLLQLLWQRKVPDVVTYFQVFFRFNLHQFISIVEMLYLFVLLSLQRRHIFVSGKHLPAQGIKLPN